MITFHIKISYDPNMMNGSLQIANKILAGLIRHAKKIKLKGLKVEIRINLAIPVKEEKVEIPPLVIAKEVCEHYGSSLRNLFITTRESETRLPRQISHYFARELNGDKYTWSNIGLFIGCKDHSTALHSWRTIRDMIATNVKFKYQMEELRSVLINLN